MTDLQRAAIALDELFADKSRWTQGAFARRKDGSECSSRSGDAACWCLLGGINRTAECLIDCGILQKMAEDISHEQHLSYTAIDVNDFRGYDAVMQVIGEVRKRLGVPRAE
jgi:hypothetical protein